MPKGDVNSKPQSATSSFQVPHSSRGGVGSGGVKGYREPSLCTKSERYRNRYLLPGGCRGGVVNPKGEWESSRGHGKCKGPEG